MVSVVNAAYENLASVQEHIPPPGLHVKDGFQTTQATSAESVNKKGMNLEGTKLVQASRSLKKC